ncbi:MAG: aldo/keto reductase [Pseudomonadota bacterium]
MLTRRATLGAAAGAAITSLLPWRAGAVTPTVGPVAKGLDSRAIPRTGELLPVIGIGTSEVFNIGSDPADRLPRRHVLDAMVAGGAKVIDTAPSYARAEAVVGELIDERKLRDRFFIATKVGVMDAESQQAELLRSLGVLRTPHVDLIQLHNVRGADTSLAFLREFQQAGKTRYVGITHWQDYSHDTLIEVIRKEKPDFLQINYSLDARAAEARLLPTARDNGVAVLINVPFGRNRLFNTVRGEQVPAFAKEFGATTWAQLFLKFILANDAVTCVIPGTDKPEYMVDNIAAGSGPVPTAVQRQQILEYWGRLTA